MMENIPIVEPSDQIYNRHLIGELLRTVPTDYYDRYDYSDLQQVILEDRRIRMNAWISKLIGKQLDRFTNPKLLANSTVEQRKDLKSHHFTIQRLEPLAYLYKKPSLTFVSLLSVEAEQFVATYSIPCDYC